MQLLGGKDSLNCFDKTITFQYHQDLQMEKY